LGDWSRNWSPTELFHLGNRTACCWNSVSLRQYPMASVLDGTRTLHFAKKLIAECKLWGRSCWFCARRSTAEGAGWLDLTEIECGSARREPWADVSAESVNQDRQL
jgi:hypothetical protein